MKGEIIAKCVDTKSVDGDSCGPRVPCDGLLDEFGNMTGGCGEPCEFIMHPEEERFAYDK